MAKSKKLVKKEDTKTTDTAQSLETDTRAKTETEPAAQEDTLHSQADVGVPPSNVDDSKQQPEKSAAHSSEKSRRTRTIIGLIIGLAAIITLLMSGILSQYYKDKVMPNVSVAGVGSGAKNQEEIKQLIQTKQQSLTIAIATKDKTLKPKPEEIGYQIDTNKTIDRALRAKREDGLLSKLAFWKTVNVAAVVGINDTLLNQYLETNLPELTKSPTDAKLDFDTNTGTFKISAQADGQGPDIDRLKQQLIESGSLLQPVNLEVKIATSRPPITEAKLQPLLAPAQQLVDRKIVLSGLGYSYKARPADIAAWITPTPQEDGTIKLVVDSAKIQSYVEGIGKKISNPPRDRKIVKDATTGAEVILQEGRDGTELADRQVLAAAIAQALKNGEDTSQVMNITTAAYKTINMDAYDKWIEVDLSEQRTTAYERATPIRSFTVATGTRGHETPEGEFSIWLRVRKQTMQGGSRADGSYYSIPNVEWVSYFYKDYALHGAWWREVFGRPASHGCVNMTNDDARWIFEWAPLGTKVIVHA